MIMYITFNTLTAIHIPGDMYALLMLCGGKISRSFPVCEVRNFVKSCRRKQLKVCIDVFFYSATKYTHFEIHIPGDMYRTELILIISMRYMPPGICTHKLRLKPTSLRVTTYLCNSLSVFQY